MATTLAVCRDAEIVFDHKIDNSEIRILWYILCSLCAVFFMTRLFPRIVRFILADH